MSDTDDSVDDEPSRKKMKITSTSSLVNVAFEGHPLFLLLELLPRIPQLDNVSLLRSVYNADPSGVEKRWEDWFYKVMNLQSNKDRCKILANTFRTLPELATQEVEQRSISHPRLLFPYVSPLFAVITEWPAEGSIPIGLLDQLKGTEKPNDYFNIFSCKCSNKNEVLMWVIRNRLSVELDLSDAIENSYTSEVLMAAAQALASEPRNEIVFVRALETALNTYGTTTCSTEMSLLRFLWRNSGHTIDLCKAMPDKFRDFVLSEVSTVAEISLKWDWTSELDWVVQMLRQMRGSITLTEWTVDGLHDEDDDEEIINAVYDVLADCPSLREFTFDCGSRDYEDGSLVRIPSMPNLDQLHLEKAFLRPESLETMMSSAREIFIKNCVLWFPTETGGVEPDCFEGWARGLAQNSRLESLWILYPSATGDCRVSGSEFLRALWSRPNLKYVDLRWKVDHQDDREAFGLEFTPADMGSFGTMASLESLALTHFPPGGLKFLLRARPRALRLLLVLRGHVALTTGDFLEFLEFLAHPECKLENLGVASGGPVFYLRSNSASEDVDERLKDPIRSLNNVLRDKNCTLTHNPLRGGNAEVEFWCNMNKTCPNRLQLRKELSDAYADQIAKLLNDNSHSEAFELVRSTFHLWTS